VARQACLHLLGFSPEAQDSGFQSFKALTFSQSTSERRSDDGSTKGAQSANICQQNSSFKTLSLMIKYVGWHGP